MSLLKQKTISLFVLLFVFSVHSFATPNSSCLAALEKLNGLIDSNRFMTQRGMDEYIEIFPDSLLVEMAKLNKEHHWIDAGSGEGYALLDFLENRGMNAEMLLQNARPNWNSPRNIHFDADLLRDATQLINAKAMVEKPQITGITFKKENGWRKYPNLDFKVGRFFEDIPLSELGHADLITDLFGVMSYSPKIDEVLSRYHSLLKPHAKAYIFVGDYVETPQYIGFLSKFIKGPTGWASAFAESVVRTKSGKKIPLIDWISSLSGFNARLEGRVIAQSERKNVPTGKVLRETLVLEKNEDPISIPKLRLIESDRGKPPLRIFEEVD